jgi:hypothetical protein
MNPLNDTWNYNKIKNICPSKDTHQWSENVSTE